MLLKNVFVTVGTTQFNELIDVVSTSDMSKWLKSVKCENLTIQYGRGNQFKNTDDKNFNGINIESFTLKDSLQSDISSSDLIISHAGAGSCIEILRLGKPLVVVVNEGLMGNHQVELAEQLCHDGHLFYCTPSTLVKTLREMNVKSLKPYGKGDASKFISCLDNLMGV